MLPSRSPVGISRKITSMCIFGRGPGRGEDREVADILVGPAVAVANTNDPGA